MLCRIFATNGRQERVGLRRHNWFFELACEGILKLLDSPLHLIGGQLTITQWVCKLLTIFGVPVLLSSILLVAEILCPSSLG